MKILEENQDELLKLLTDNKFLAISYDDKEVKEAHKEFPKNLKKPTKIWWFDASTNSDFLTDEEAKEFLLDFLDGGLPPITEKHEEFHPHVNKGGFINNAFLPIFFMYKHEDGWLVCSASMESVPSYKVMDMCLFQDELDLMLETMTTAKDVMKEIELPFMDSEGRGIVSEKVVPLLVIDSDIDEFKRISKSPSATHEIMDAAKGMAKPVLKEDGRIVLSVTTLSDEYYEIFKRIDDGKLIHPIGEIADADGNYTFELVRGYFIVFDNKPQLKKVK